MEPSYQFTNNWFASTSFYWSQLFENLHWNPEAPHVVVEIGCFEGQSTCWILNNLLKNPDSALYCIDTFEAGTLDVFSRNVSLTKKEDLIHLHIGRSQHALCLLVQDEVICDFIYVDGSHRSKDVLTDATISWLLLKSGGLMIFDDYHWRWPGNSTLDNPKLGIDSFVNCFSDEIQVLNTPQNYQLCLLKA